MRLIKLLGGYTNITEELMMKKSDLIYLACPYSEGNPSDELMHTRAAIATYVAGCLIKLGHVVFSPLTHNEPINAVVKLPRTWDFWCKFDSTFLLRCDMLMVLCIEGWDTSVGVLDEIRIAKENKISIKYIQYDDRYDTVRIFRKLEDLCRI